MPKTGEFEDGKKRLEAQLEAVTHELDNFQIRNDSRSLQQTCLSEEEFVDLAKRSDDRAQQLMGIRHYRRLLCEDNNPHVQRIIELGLVPHFVKAMKAEDCQLLQLEAAWALTNVSAGSCEETRVVIENGALPILTEFMSRHSIDLKEQAIWAIGNIAAEKSFLTSLIDKGALERILLILEKERGNIRLARISVWALANFCRYGTTAVRITSDYIPRIADVLCKLLKHTDRQVLNDTVWAIASFTTADWTNDSKELLVQNGVLRGLAELIIHSDRPSLHYPALKAAAQLLSGPESYAAEFLAVGGILAKLKKFLTTRINRKTLSNVLWLLQNIVANKFRVAAKVFTSGIVPRIVDLVIYGPYEVKTEAGLVLNNLFYIVDLPVRALDSLIGADTIRGLCAMLTWESKQTVLDVLTALEKVLAEGEKPTAYKLYNLSTADEPYCSTVATIKKRVRRARQEESGRFNAVAQRIFNAGGKETLLLLADHEDGYIKQHAIAILQKYFDTENLSSSFSDSDEEEQTHPEMFDENGDHEVDPANESRDEMALCEDMLAGFALWDPKTATSQL